MALAAIPDEISRHIEAALVLSKREVLLRVLDAADLCLRLEQLATATILAGIVLEEASLLLSPRTFEEHRDNVNAWREMRNRTAHAGPVRPALSAEQVSAMVIGVRAMLDTPQRPLAQSTSQPSIEDGLTKTRGKYAFVQTSVDEFLKRKRDDLEVENQR